MPKYSARSRQIRLAHLTTMIFIALLAMAVALEAGLQSAHSADDGKTIPLTKANVFFELNNTDDDLGIHVTIDGEADGTEDHH